MRSRTFVFLLLLFMSSPAGRGYAQEQGQVTLKSLIQKEVVTINDKGEKEVRLTEVANALPGDELIFTITYSNEGKEPAENVVLDNPVPEHTAYMAGTAGGENARITFSADGGVTYGAPGDVGITGEDGKTRTARAEEYTNIRWTLGAPLPPGESGKVFFRAMLK